MLLIPTYLLQSAINLIHYYINTKSTNMYEKEKENRFLPDERSDREPVNEPPIPFRTSYLPNHQQYKSNNIYCLLSEAQVRAGLPL